MPGDIVLFRPPSEGIGGSVEEILQRKNQLPRPMISNIDLLMIVVSAGKAEADLQLVDKLLLYAAQNGVLAAIIFSKVDTVGGQSPLAAQYRGCGAEIVEFSALTKQGMQQVKTLLSGKFTCLAGQSAVGKSTLLNALSPSLCLLTGELSEKTKRGKHTTRHSELLLLPDLDAIVADTPGFSMLKCIDIQPEELRSYYPEFAGFEKKCRFDGCTHHKEPQCGVKEAVEAGLISRQRYMRYLKLLQELMERRQNRYV